jgi:excisionase family DNA binding protein
VSSEVKFLTIEQVAEMLQVTRMTIYNLQKKGLPFIKLGKNVRFDKDDIIEWVNSNKVTLVKDEK